MSVKQDRQQARTPADLERKYAFERSFSEIMGIALDTQRAVEDSKKKIDAELSLKLGYDDSNKIIAMINASADTISLKSNRLEIESDNFALSSNGHLKARGVEIEGDISATSGQIGGCLIQDGTLHLENAVATGAVWSGVTVTGIIYSEEGLLGSVAITRDGLTCGDTYLSDGGIRTSNGSDTTLIAGGVVKFGSGGSYALYAPRSSVSGAFLGVYASGSWRTLYFDDATGCVKFT